MTYFPILLSVIFAGAALLFFGNSEGALNAIRKALKVLEDISKPRPKYKYDRCPIMTNNELELFNRISCAIPEYYVFPQVSMAAIIKPKDSDKRIKQAAFRSISQKRIDYSIFTKTMRLICVIELDDRTHDARKDYLRDATLETAGIKTIRWNSKNKPKIEEIKVQLEKLIQATTPNENNRFSQ